MPLKFDLHPVLYKIFIREYYRQNTGLLGLVLFVALGLTPLHAHLNLARLGANNPLFLWAVFGLPWILYAIKVQVFLLNAWQKPVNECCFYLACLPTGSVYFQCLLVQTGLMIPVTTYGLFLIRVLAKEHAVFAIMQIVLMLVLLTVIPPLQTQRRVFQPNRRQNQLPLLPDFKWPQRGFATFLYLRRLFADGKGMLMLIKSISVFLIRGVCHLYPTDQYDSRLLSLGLLFSAVAHASIFWFWHRADFSQNLFFRNLPIPARKRFMQSAFAFFLMAIPEMLLMYRHLPPEVSEAWLSGALVFFTGIMAFGFHYQYFQPIPPDEPPKAFLLCSFVLALLIMYGIPVWILGLLLWTVSFFLFHFYYFKAEWQPE